MRAVFLCFFSGFIFSVLRLLLEERVFFHNNLPVTAKQPHYITDWNMHPIKPDGELGLFYQKPFQPNSVMKFFPGASVGKLRLFL